jgi:FixJ family two-component response regulator
MTVDHSTALIYLVDDDPSVLDSLTEMLDSGGYASSAFESAHGFLQNYDPEQLSCLILDVKMPEMGGLELQEECVKRAITIPIIFFSGNDPTIPDSVKAMSAGAITFLEKPFSYGQLLTHIRKAIDIDRVTKARRSERHKIQARFNQLTVREKEVLQLVVNSYSNKEAARLLDISPRTIDAHRARVMEKMQADNIAELVTLVMTYDLLSMLSSTESMGILLT